MREGGKERRRRRISKKKDVAVGCWRAEKDEKNMKEEEREGEMEGERKKR